MQTEMKNKRQAASTFTKSRQSERCKTETVMGSSYYKRKKKVDVAVEEFQNAEPEDNGEYG